MYIFLYYAPLLTAPHDACFTAVACCSYAYIGAGVQQLLGSLRKTHTQREGHTHTHKGVCETADASARTKAQDKNVCVGTRKTTISNAGTAKSAA